MMTLHDLYRAVSQLGFEDSLGDDSTTRFIYAANRALIEINALRPRRMRVDINHRVPKNLLFSEPCTIEKNKPLVFKAQGAKSFYFEVSGQGNITSFGLERISVDNEGKKTTSIVSDNLPGTVTSFNHKTFTPKQGFITFSGAFVDNLMESNTDSEYYTGNAIIEFGGNYDYTIRNLAMYDRVYSDSVDDIIPYGNQVAYNVTDFVADFDKFDSFPVDADGKHLTEGFSIENSTVYLPTNKSGIYTINYLHKVTLIDNQAEVTSSTEIDLEDDLVALLPNLIAAYVWLDDEAEKSQYYYNLYMQRAEQIKRETVNLNPVAFESVYGW